MSTGPTALAGRATAPDLARGLMLLLIALANVHLFLHGPAPVGARGYPAPGSTADRAVAITQLVLVDGRAYPLFGALLGYGLVRAAERAPSDAPARALYRRGVALLVLGALHGVLLFSGDILGAYGLLTLILAGGVLTAVPAVLVGLAAIGSLLGALVAAGQGVPTGAPYQPSAATTDALAALGERAAEWPSGTVTSLVLVLPATLVGVWAGRAGVLDAPREHRRLLGLWALGLPVGALLGLPLALSAVGAWRPTTTTGTLSGFAHGVGGYLGALGWLGLLGLVATVRVPLRATLAAAGTWSLTLYVTQSVVFTGLLAAWAGGLGDRLSLASAALLAVATWAVSTLVAGALARGGHRGPLELLVRRVAYPRT
jgi:uncharacterized protein